MKHYPVTVAGIKASASVETGWSWATVSIKFPHRKGQSVTFNHFSNGYVSNIWVDEYPTYTAIRFETKQGYFKTPQDAVRYCTHLIKKVNYHVNFEADIVFVTKELLTILG